MPTPTAPEGAPSPARNSRKLTDAQLDLKHAIQDFWAYRLKGNRAQLLKRIAEQTFLYTPGSDCAERQTDLPFMLAGNWRNGVSLDIPIRTAHRASRDLQDWGLVTVRDVFIPRQGFRPVYGVDVERLIGRDDSLIPKRVSQPVALTAKLAERSLPKRQRGDCQNGSINSQNRTPGKELPIATYPDLRASGASGRECSFQASPISAEPSSTSSVVADADEKNERRDEKNLPSLSSVVASEVAWRTALSGNDLTVISSLARLALDGVTGPTVNRITSDTGIAPGLVSHIIEGIKYQWPDLLSRQRHGRIHIDLPRFVLGPAPMETTAPGPEEGQEDNGRWLFGVPGWQRCYSQEEWEALEAEELLERDAERMEANRLFASAVAAPDADTAYALAHEAVLLLRESVYAFDDVIPDAEWVEDRAMRFMIENDLGRKPDHPSYARPAQQRSGVG